MYDVVIVGGGIAGLGIAQAAARRGLSPLVLERNDFAAHTSNNSLRIIHGGFRYLQSFDIPRVLMSRRAQARIMRSYPE
ncbi:MAG: FAD-dependent oxidoreductase, partial [Bdellovibrionales bacterium]|nr:FAD-dependent oxidoreductase [Bdellovibrionales bacterium]